MHEPTCVHTYLLLLAACKGAPLVIHLEQTVNRGLGEQAVQSVLSYPHTQVLSQLSIINHSSIYIPFSSWESRSLLKCVRSPTYIRTQVSERDHHTYVLPHLEIAQKTAYIHIPTQVCTDTYNMLDIMH